nr:Chain C, ILE-LEU-ALA-LYS-PHE-LEU-HIS-GLU-LEU [Homo sapiens]5MER_F Chain F, ILE-LEU-ALA-LYS-PHE-LEU-HIS-GLU-LEU [Homo sapiens]
ILAKFLHEL